MKRELIIEKTAGAGDWVPLDLGDEVPAMVFQINDLNDLKDRQASYSQALELPITPNNCRAFGFANEFGARSNVPYSLHRCAWYEDGIQILGTNFRLELLSVSDTFKCQIISTVAGLFNLLQTLGMEDLNLLPVPWNHTRIIADLTADDPNSLYAWAFPVTIQENVGIYSASRGRFMAAEVMLYFRLLPLVREILEQAGYTLDTDVESVPGYTPDYISLPDFRPGDGSMGPLQGIAEGPQFTATSESMDAYPVYLFSDISNSTFNYSEVRTLDWVHDPDIPTQITKGFEYCAPGYMKCKVAMMVSGMGSDGTPDFESGIRYRVQRIGRTIPGAYTYPGQDVLYSADWSATPTDWRESDIIEMYPGDRIYVEAILLGGVTGATYDSAFRIIVPPDENAVPAGGDLYPNLSTGFKTQLDVIKMFVQLYGLFVDVNSDAKIFRAQSFYGMLNRIGLGDFVDWSDKIDIEQTREVSFKVGAYAQRNRILWGNNELLNFQDSGEIRVENDNLPESKDLFTLAAESTKNGALTFYAGPTGTGQPADIDIRYEGTGSRFEFQSWNPSTEPVGPEIPIVKYRASKTHIIHRVQANDPQVTPGNITVTMLPRSIVNTGGYYGVVNWSYCYAAVGVPAEYYVETYYPVLEANILNPARVVEAAFNLTPSDIENLDLLRPVYIKKYGAFFYIQKINNYQARKLTKVTLVCLNTANN